MLMHKESSTFNFSFFRRERKYKHTDVRDVTSDCSMLMNCEQHWL